MEGTDPWDGPLIDPFCSSQRAPPRLGGLPCFFETTVPLTTYPHPALPFSLSPLSASQNCPFSPLPFLSFCILHPAPPSAPRRPHMILFL